MRRRSGRWWCGGKDRPARRAAYFAVAARRAVSAAVGAERRDAGCAAVVAAPAEAGGAAHAGEEPVATLGAQPGRATETAPVEPRRSCGVGGFAARGLDGAAPGGFAGDAGSFGSASERTGRGGVPGSLATAGGAAVDEPSGRGTGDRTGLRFDHRTGGAFSARQASRELPGPDSARAFLGRASETGSDQQAREHHDAHAVGGSGAECGPAGSGVAAGLSTFEGAETFGAGQSDGGPQAGRTDVLDAA